ncbi:two-component system regulatory protein YycI [Oceanobacillus rekensis]|uniref:two-component system regulatory protein YycI n=1 Tax=Oceanobacillus rekensis TaxID=937927 RepID=UPI000B42FB54|nr:two-component system regulatory protein YycI [Oceanobacillus rekensis]
MQWGHIKTLFILSFLVLNIYLLVQFVERQQNSAEMGVLESSNENVSYEELFEQENITISAELSQDLSETNYINVSEKKFTDEEVGQLNNIDGLDATLIDDNFILAQFERPLSLPANLTKDNISDLVAPYLLYPEQYTYWVWDEESNIFMFFQQKDNKPIYFNQNALLLFYVNDNDEITHYTQTMLGDAEQQGNTEEIISPIKAIGSLYDRGSLTQDENVSDVSLGYLSRIESQVFAPTWKVTINEDEIYFVNAIEGLVYSEEESVFIQKAIINNLDIIRLLPEENDMKAPAVVVLNQKLDSEENRSELE